MTHPRADQPQPPPVEASARTHTQEPQPVPILWTVRDVERFARCSIRQVAHLRAAGLPFVKIGQLVRFHPPRVIGWLMSHGGSAGRSGAQLQNFGEVAS